MIQLFEALVARASRSLDLLAGLVLAFTAGLIVANILGRVVLNRPILGTYELVGYLTATVVALALARCALENSHIAISFFTDRLSIRLQRAISVFVDLPVIIFLFFAAYNLFVYGSRIAASGEVAPTTKIIFYPFIYLAAFGFFILALAVVLKFLQLFKEGEKEWTL